VQTIAGGGAVRTCSRCEGRRVVLSARGQVLGIKTVDRRRSDRRGPRHRAKCSGQQGGGWQRECGVVLNHGTQVMLLVLDVTGSIRRWPCA
jgi:hypothetical protein